jgi:thioredoxin-related protein
MTRLHPVLASCLFALLSTAPVLAGTAAKTTAPALTWRDWDKGLDEAKASDRPVLVDVVTSWCGWCKRMDADVYSNPQVRDYLAKKFVTVRIDAESTAPARYEGKAQTSQSLAARFGVSGYPTTVFLHSSGDRPLSVPGYVDAEHFMQVLRYVGDGHMDAGVSFEDFKKRMAAGGAAKH